MEHLIIRSVRKILANKAELEKKLKVKIELKGKNLIFDGDEVDEFVAEKVIDAMDLGFSLRVALFLLDEDYMFEKVRIKELSKKNPSVIRARIIGTRRKTLDTIEEITSCNIVLHENIVGIIGHVEDIKGAMQAILNLVKGAKNSNVYAYLERLNSRRLPFVLQLRKEKGRSDIKDKKKKSKKDQFKKEEIEVKDIEDSEDNFRDFEGE